MSIKQRANKYIKVLVILTIFSSFVYSQNIQAETYSVQMNAQVFLIEQNKRKEIPNEITLEELSIGSTLEFQIRIKSTENTITSKVEAIENKSFSYLDYANAVPSINGSSMSENQYQEFINNGGMSLTLSGETIITFRVSYMKDYDALMLKVKASAVKNGQNVSHSSSFDYYVSTTYRKQYSVTFYDYDHSIISKQSVERDRYASAPTMNREGYTFLGFNTKKDGSGEYFNNHKISASINYYAQYKQKKYKVNYYVGTTLFDSKVVLHGHDAPNIIIEDSEELTFLKWSKPLTSITQSMDVYAIFLNKEGKEVLEEKVSKDKQFTISLSRIKGNSDILKANSSAVIRYDNDTKQYVIENESNTNIVDEVIETVTNVVKQKGYIILLYIVFVAGVSLTYKKMKKR